MIYTEQVENKNFVSRIEKLLDNRVQFTVSYDYEGMVWEVSYPKAACPTELHDIQEE